MDIVEHNGNTVQEIQPIAPTVANLRTYLKVPDGKTPPVTFIREPGDIKIDIKDAQNFTVSGTKINDQFQKMQSEILELQKKAMQGLAPDQQQVVLKQVIGSIYGYVKENIQNPTGEQLFLSIASQLDPKQVQEVLKDARPAFKEKDQVKSLLKIVDSKGKIASSGQYQDVELVDPNGVKASLSAHVGKSKYVLIDFWASWCQPCMQEMPNVLSIYSKYKAKGLEIVGISLDKDKESWLNAVKENNMTWPQLNDVDGKATQIYGVQSIPHTILVDQTGKIVADNLRGEEIEAKLSELLK